MKVPKLNKKDEKKVITLEYTRRSFDLDDLIAPKDHVVTGARFRVLGGHINLEIQVQYLSNKHCNFKIIFSQLI